MDGLVGRYLPTDTYTKLIPTLTATILCNEGTSAVCLECVYLECARVCFQGRRFERFMIAVSYAIDI